MKYHSHYTFFALLLAISFIVSSCVVKTNDEPSEKSTVSLTPGSFNRIHLVGVENVTFSQGDTTTVVMTGDNKLIDTYDVDVEDGCLTIKSNKKVIIKKHSVEIFITSPDIEEVSIEGAGKFSLKDEIKTEKLDLYLGGAGALSVDKVECDDLKVKVDGTGKVDLDGITAKNVSISMSGVGNINAFFVNSGDVEAALDGVGSVTFEGNVKSLKKNSSGIGNINTKKLVIGE